MIERRGIEFTPELISLIFFAVALIAGVISMMTTRSARREVAAGWVAAVVVPALDFLIESHAAHAGWWRLHGVGVVLGVPLIYPAGWIFFTFHFFMLYAAARRRVRTWLPLLLSFISVGAGIGIFWNYLGSSRLGILTFQSASLFCVVPVWLFLVATGLVIFQALTRSEHPPRNRIPSRPT
jgi:hypothetical protein